MPHIVVVGSTNVDLTFRVPRLPRHVETLSATGLHTGFGGKGANQAVMAAVLGADVFMVSAVGDDVFGEDPTQEAEHGLEGLNALYARLGPGGDANLEGEAGFLEELLGDGHRVLLEEYAMVGAVGERHHPRHDREDSAFGRDLDRVDDAVERSRRNARVV